MDSLRILIIDDDEFQLDFIRLIIEDIDEGRHATFASANVDEAVEIFSENPIDLVLTDYYMPDFSGLDVLKKLKEINPAIDVVVITQYSDIQVAIDVIKQGAYDYLIKPLSKEVLENLILRIQEKQTLVKENRLLKEQIQERYDFQSIISQSPEMEEVLNTTWKSAKSNVNVLIHGESGTGKELIARAIHYAGSRKDKPFVVVNISALSEGLIESELYGHKKGAFTGAIRDHTGRFRQANRGTLFIDEVGDIPPSIQVKLLRTIQFGTIEPVGSSESIKVDVRIISATSRDLEQMIQEEKFRPDFYYRLNVVAIEIPPLRKRKTDIPLLVDHIISNYARTHHRNIRNISQEALDALLKYDFPGNVRELENILQRAIVLCRGETITTKDLPNLGKNGNGGTPGGSLLDPKVISGDYAEKMNAFESTLIREALESTKGNKSAAARLLGIGERRLRYRMQVLDIKEG
jgi:DNA-binding NtrC family response regulator